MSSGPNVIIQVSPSLHLQKSQIIKCLCHFKAMRAIAASTLCLRNFKVTKPTSVKVRQKRQYIYRRCKWSYVINRMSLANCFCQCCAVNENIWSAKKQIIRGATVHTLDRQWCKCRGLQRLVELWNNYRLYYFVSNGLYRSVPEGFVKAFCARSSLKGIAQTHSAFVELKILIVSFLKAP